MTIDSHSHWLPEKIINNAHFFHKGWSDIESQLKMMDKEGIDKAVLSYPTSDAHLKLGSISEVAQIYNNSIARILKHYPNRFIGAAILSIDSAQDMVDEIKRLTEELGFGALSLASSYNGMYLDNAMFLPIFRHAREKNIPIFIHSQIVNPIGYDRVKDPLLTPVIEYVFDTTICVGKLLMADILRDYADLKFIFAHFAGVTPFLTYRFDTTYKMLRGLNFVKDLKGNPSDYLRNIYVDTSGDTNKVNFLAALELFGASHILWGSDWPAKKDITGSINAINNLSISQEDKANILGTNLEKILSSSTNNPFPAS